MDWNSKVIFLFLWIISLLPLGGCLKREKGNKKAVLIHSFEPVRYNYSVFNDILVKELEKQNIYPDLVTFYLDCEKKDNQVELQVMNMFLDSISNIKPDIILVNDDQATFRLLSTHHPLLKKIPIVFAGVNYPDWKQLREYPNVTGLYDKQDFYKNIQFINEILGPIRIKIGYDKTALGTKAFDNFFDQIRNKEDIELIRFQVNHIKRDPLYIGNEMAISKLEEYTEGGAAPEKRISNKYIAQVEFTPFRIQRNSSLFENLSRIENNSTYLDIKYDYTSEAYSLLVKYPSFTAHNEPLSYKNSDEESFDNNRFIGGYFTSLDTQAKEQARMAASILKGKDVKDIPVKISSKEYLLSWTMIRKMDISLKNIPSEVRIIGMPFYERFRVWIVIFFVMIFVALTLLAIFLERLYKKEEKRKKEVKMELAKQNINLRVALEKAKESDRMKSMFLANMSHEIRTPLNAIVGFSNLLIDSDDLDEEEKQEFKSLINTNSTSLLQLINDILDLSRLEAGKMAFNYATYNLNTLLKEVYNTFKLMTPNGVDLILDIPNIDLKIHTDKYRLEQVIINFINNAIKFTSRGYIKLGYKYEDGDEAVKIFVKDTGMGIPKEKTEKLFQQFVKLDEFAKGSGLGLYICKIIVEQFKGDIYVESEVGKGSCFYIVIPIKENAPNKGDDTVDI